MVFARCHMLAHMLGHVLFLQSCFASLRVFRGREWEGQRIEEENEISPIRATAMWVTSSFTEDPFVLGFRIAEFACSRFWCLN